jgi:hypothetical protein
MKAVDYFRRAYQDPLFREQKLDDLRYLRNVALGLFVFVAVFACGTAIYIGMEDGWKAALLGTGAIWIGPLILSRGHADEGVIAKRRTVWRC